MKSATKIVADNGQERIAVSVKSNGSKTLTRAESQYKHNLRVDRITEALSRDFHFKNIRVS